MSTGVVIAIAGVALALMVMLISVSVMLGFKNQIRKKVIGFQSQLTIQPYSISEPTMIPAIDFSPQLSSAIKSALPSGASVTPSVTGTAILKTDDDFAGIIAKGITSGADLDFIASNIVEGSAEDFVNDSTGYATIISRRIADRLGITAGDRISAFFVSDNGVRQRRLAIAAVYDTHFDDYDKSFIFVGIDMMRKVQGLTDNQATAIEITGLNTDQDIDQAQSALSHALNMARYKGITSDVMTISNVRQSAAMYFNWLDLIDTNVVVILVLMTLVSGLTLISSLFIIVLERVNMIGILKAIGATNGLIRRIFIIVAERLVITGLIIGNVLSISFILLQEHFHFIPLDPEAYYLDSVPVEISWWWIAGINLAVIAISALILIVPSRIVSTISPAVAVRFE